METLDNNNNPNVLYSQPEMDNNNDPRILNIQEEDDYLRIRHEKEMNTPIGRIQVVCENIISDIFILRNNHDCHLSPDDGCKTCELLESIRMYVEEIIYLLKKL